MTLSLPPALSPKTYTASSKWILIAWFVSKKQKVKYFWDSIAEFFWGISLQLEMISVFFYHLVTPLFSKQLIHEFPIKAIH